MKEFFENLTDKKFLMAFVSVITGILTLYNIEDNTISLVTSLTLIVLPVIGYIISEGVLDWKKINMAITEILQIIDDYIQSEKEEKENKTDTEEIEEETDKNKIEELSGSVIINGEEISKEKEVIYRIATILRTLQK